MPNYIGLDPSLGSFGVCVYATTSPTRHLTSAYKSDPATGLEARLARYYGLIDPVMDRVVKWQPKLIAIEQYVYGATGRGIVDRAEMGGILRDRLHQTGLQVIEVGPTTLKRFITGKGGGKGTDKVGMIMAIYQRYGVDFSGKTSDEADAYGLARLAAVYNGSEKPQTKFQEEAVAVVRNPKVKTRRQ